MNQTQVQPSKAGRTLLGHTAETPTVDICQRAPTLMAGASAGTQGTVRIWAPARPRGWMIDLIAVAIGCSFIFAGYLAVMQHLALMPAAIFYLFGGYCLGGVWETIRRPIYISTDDAGIGITTRAGCRALRWSEIKELERDPSSEFVRLTAGESVTISLFGHRKDAQEELLALITSRASLQQTLPKPSSRNAIHFVRVPALPQSTMILGPDAALPAG